MLLCSCTKWEFRARPVSYTHLDVYKRQNQQSFGFMLDGDKVLAKAGKGILSDMDLGIVKYHFEIGSGKEFFKDEICLLYTSRCV